MGRHRYLLWSSPSPSRHTPEGPRPLSLSTASAATTYRSAHFLCHVVALPGEKKAYITLPPTPPSPHTPSPCTETSISVKRSNSGPLTSAPFTLHLYELGCPPRPALTAGKAGANSVQRLAVILGPFSVSFLKTSRRRGELLVLFLRHVLCRDRHDLLRALIGLCFGLGPLSFSLIKVLLSSFLPMVLVYPSRLLCFFPGLWLAVKTVPVTSFFFSFPIFLLLSQGRRESPPLCIPKKGSDPAVKASSEGALPPPLTPRNG